MKRGIVILTVCFVIPLLSGIKAQWEEVNNGILPLIKDSTSLKIQQIEILGNYILASQYLSGRLYYSSNLGEKWGEFPRPDVPDSSLVGAIYTSGDTLYAIYFTERDSSYKYPDDTSITITISIRDQTLFRTTDLGKSWTRHWSLSSIDTIPMKIYASGSNLFLCGSNFILYSSNEGKSWSQRQNGLPMRFYFQDIQVDKYGSIYLALAEEGIYKSINLGERWEKINPSRSYGFGFYKIYTKDSLIFSGTLYYGYLLSTNYGRSWDHIRINNSLIATVKEVYLSGNLLMIGVNQSIFSSNEKALYAFGFYLSTDFGRTWKQVLAGLPELTGKLAYAVYSIKEKDDYIFISFSKFGIFRIPKAKLLEIASSVVSQGMYNFYAFGQLPIPADEYVNFKIYWDADGFEISNIGIAVYNVYGQLVSSREHIGIMEISKNSALFRWNCSDFPTGVYFIALSYKTQTRILRAIVVK